MPPGWTSFLHVGTVSLLSRSGLPKRWKYECLRGTVSLLSRDRTALATRAGAARPRRLPDLRGGDPFASRSVGRSNPEQDKRDTVPLKLSRPDRFGNPERDKRDTVPVKACRGSPEAAARMRVAGLAIGRSASGMRISGCGRSRKGWRRARRRSARRSCARATLDGAVLCFTLRRHDSRSVRRRCGGQPRLGGDVPGLPPSLKQRARCKRYPGLWGRRRGRRDGKARRRGSPRGNRGTR